MRKTYKRNHHVRFSKKRKSRHQKKGGVKDSEMYGRLYPIKKQNSNKSARKTQRKRPTSAPGRAQNYSFRKTSKKPLPHYSAVNRQTKKNKQKKTVDAPLGYSNF